MVYFDDGSSKRRKGLYRKNRPYWLLYLAIGAAVGAFLFAVALPKIVEYNILPYQIYLVSEEQVDQNSHVKQGDRSQLLDLISPVHVDISTQVTSIVEQVMPAVVGVENIQKQGFNFWDQATYDGGTGSGVIYRVDGEHAHVVTNHHVIEGADQIEVILEDGTRVMAELIGSDLFTDLAVLQIDSSNINVAIDIGNSELAKVGEPVIAIGNPLGFDLAGSVTQGIISGKQRSIPLDYSGDGRADWQVEVIQTDAAINPGNSGGALINMSGQLIGINSMKISQSYVEGIGFAIPIDEALPVINELEHNGEMTRAFLGVEAYSLVEVPKVEWSTSLNLPSSVEGGIYVQSVEPLSPAELAGIEPYDVIVALDGEPVYTIVDLRKHLYQEKAPGEDMVITFYRENERREVTVELSTQ